MAFVENNKRMPKEAKERVLAQLSQPQVSAKTIARIESRMGG
jgi:transposase-like protein